MAIGSFTIKGMDDFQNEIKKLENSNMDEFFEDCAKELAARLLAKVIKATPVGVYPAGSGKVGGTLRRGWTAGNNTGARSYAQSLNITQAGNAYTIEITNPVEYASYVEYGHRTRGGRGWVQGQFMLTISIEELEKTTPRILSNKLKKYIGGAST